MTTSKCLSNYEISFSNLVSHGKSLNKFTTLMLDVREKTKKDKLFYFIDGLSWETSIEL